MNSAQRMFSGKNVIWSLILFLVFLLYSQYSTQDSNLNSLLNPKNTPTPQITAQPLQNEDIVREIEPTEEPLITTGAVQGASTGKQIGQVVKVVDGDTLDIEIGGVRDKVRVIGINTPETVDPRREVECFGKEASNFAKQTLSGKTIYLESDPTQTNRDRYNRLLRFVFLSEGAIDYGKLAIQEGYANEYTYDKPYKYQKEYKQAEHGAQTAKKGLWADNACKT